MLAEAQAKAELALEEERQTYRILAEAQRKAKRQIIGIAILLLFLVGATGALVMAGKANQQAERKTTVELQKAQQKIIELKRKIAELEAK
jgi:hypothetical protein